MGDFILPRKCCICGDDYDIRRVSHAGFIPDEAMCRSCFEAWDGENDFDDLDPITEGIAK